MNIVYSLGLGLLIYFNFVFFNKSIFAATKNPIELAAPEILLAGWNARCLSHADLNSDGLEDLVYFNLDKSYIEILYRCLPGEQPPSIRPVKKNRWEPELADAPYKTERIFVTGLVTDIEIGDLNGDQRLDLITGSPADGIKVYFRQENATWSEGFEIESRKIRPYAMSLKVQLGASGYNDKLHIFTEDGLETIRFDSGKPLYPSSLAREDDKKAFGVHLQDLNGDKFLDWMYLVSGDENSLKVRLGGKSGFGAEQSFQLKLASFPSPIDETADQGQNLFCSIDSTSNEAVVFSLDPETTGDQSVKLRVMTYDLFSESNKDCSWTWGDFDGDKNLDLVAASPSKGEVLFMRGDQSGNFAYPRVFPSLRGISKLSTNRKKQNSNLLILSQDEEVVGLSSFIEGKGFQFPKLIKVAGAPILAESFDLDGNDRDEIVLVCEKDSRFLLETFVAKQDGEYQSSNTYEFEDLNRDPEGLFPCNLNGDKWTDLLVLSSREAPVVLLGTKDGKWKLGAEDSIIRKSFLKGIELSKIGRDARVSGDHLFIASKGCVRIICWDDEDFTTVEQVNSKNQAGDLFCPVMFQFKNSRNPELVAFHEDGYWEKLSGENLFSKNFNRLEDTFSEPSFAMAITTKNGSYLISLGKSGFQVIDEKPTRGLSLKVESRYLTDLPNIRPNGIECGDFNGDGIEDLVLLDGKKNMLEFLLMDSNRSNWASAMHFEVFEKNLHYRGKKGSVYEPREGLVLDLDGDSLDDMVFLVHDRLLFYHQVGSQQK